MVNMYQFPQLIQQEIAIIEQLNRVVADQSKKLKPGRLIARKRKRGFVYYERDGDAGALDGERVLEIKKYQYFKQLASRLAHDRILLEQMLKKYKPYDPLTINANLPGAYRLTEEDYAQAIAGKRQDRLLKATDDKNFIWVKKPYPKNRYPLPQYPCVANDETPVRSLGEVIIYNLLKQYGIPFRYDCEIELIDEHGNTVHRHPDFIISLADGSLLYWEHVGMIGNEEYGSAFIQKLALYNRNGIVLGDNLIVTANGPNGAINVPAIERLIVNRIVPYIRKVK